MEPLIKQIRVRFSGGQERTEESGSVNDRRTPPQKTQSFKERRKTKNWFQRKLSRKTSQDYDFNDSIEHATAVAAAAYAIKSIEESATSEPKRADNEPKTSLVRMKSKKEEATTLKPEPGRVSKIFSGSGSAKRNPEQEDVQVTTGKSPEIVPDLSTTTKPAGPSNEIKGQSSPAPGIRKTQADAWEEAEIARLKERYEKQEATILSWENKKKNKSRNKLGRIESELQQKRAKALQKFSRDMEHIKQIAEGARAKAEERHKKEVLKVKEKANTIRRTGNPTTRCCF